MKKFMCIVLILCSLTFFGCSSQSTSNATKKTSEMSEILPSNPSSETSSNLSGSSNETNNKKEDPNKNVTIATEKNNSTKTMPKPKSSTSKNSEKPQSNSSKNNPSLPNPSQNKPSEEELMNLVLNAESSLKPIFKGTAYHSKNIIVQNGFQYGEVTDFKSRDAMKKHLSPYFTDTVIENILNKYLIEVDGKLYFTLGDAGLRVDYKTCKKEFSYEKDKITINLTEQYNNEDMFTETKTLGLINGKWLFIDFWYV